MSNAAKWILAGVISVGLTGYAPPATYAQTGVAEDLCRTTGTAFAFFNGVQTTPDGADAALAEFRRIHGTTSPTGDPIRYEKFYNYSAGFEDFVETFEQRLQEHDGLLAGRYELFFEAINGDGPWWSTIINTIGSAGELLTELVQWQQAAAIRNLTTLLGDPPTAVNYAEHKSRIDNLLLEGKKLLLVAHSQGNLFMNAAYNYATTKTEPASVKAVHIAPASPSLNGEHTLADLDLVINGLRVVGSVAAITDLIPGYLLRPPGINGNKDPLGHGLLEIYINQRLEIAARVRNHITDALTSLVSPTTAATPGFFSATLTWDGYGDVDLHTIEPGGTHVFYAAKQGEAGFLDVDNVVADGPEHYYASCSPAVLKTGTYRVEVANYRGADGRTATVQIASWSDGVIGTRSVTLAGSTRDTPSDRLFNVTVTKSDQTEKYSVSID